MSTLTTVLSARATADAFGAQLSETKYMVGLLKVVNEWLVRALVLLSLAAYLVLIFLAGTRRRRASGWRMLLLWPAYQVANLAATQALGNLSLGSTSKELQLVAFWTPFLLMHLGRPDNISALSLEDNVLAARQVLEAAMQVLAAIYILYKHIVVGGDAGTLLPASFLMFFLGIAKYMEGTAALWQGNLDNIRSSLKTLSPKGYSYPLHRDGNDHELDNEHALQAAHDLFYVSKGAFADYSFSKNPLKRDLLNTKEFSRGWKGVLKVVEMELSLMYDIMYTKAAVVHTWVGYGIRVVSLPFTAAAFSLFWLHSKQGQRPVDVVITYILLVVTFILDVKCLLGALGSTWTYAFISDRHWLHGSLGRWLGLRCFVVSLDPSRLFVEEPTSYRMWSGTIGRYNLLREYSHETTCILSSLVQVFATEGIWMEYQYGFLNGLKILPVIRDLLFEKVWEKLKSPYLEEQTPEEKKKAKEKEAEEKKKKESEEKKKPIVPDPTGGFKNRMKLEKALKIFSEFEEIVLTWHIATEVFLLSGQENTTSRSFDRFKYVKLIQELSDYMMFVAAVRPNMLPGLKLSSLHEATSDILKYIWRHKAANPCCTSRDKELERTMRNMENMEGSEPGSRSELFDLSVILSNGTRYANLMLKRLSTFTEESERLKDMPNHHHLLPPDLWYGKVLELEEMFKLILDAWVTLLIHASTRCSRDSHAKQLGRGGELTTIVWILAEHAAIDKQTQDN